MKKVSDSQSDLFDRLASGDALYLYKPEALSRLNALHADKGRMLDVGCGDGAIGCALDGTPVVAFDISRQCVRLAKEKGLQALVADALTALPFPPETFDSIYCVDVLHHLDQQWNRLFDEFDRVLRPGGTLVIVEPDARNPFVRWTQGPRSPIRVAPWPNEPAIYPATLETHLRDRRYAYALAPIQIEGEQVIRSVFPLWQRLLKAPFVIACAFIWRNRPNKFAIVAKKKTETT